MKLTCNDCGKQVSTKIPAETIVRAAIQCPECIDKISPLLSVTSGGFTTVAKNGPLHYSINEENGMEVARSQSELWANEFSQAINAHDALVNACRIGAEIQHETAYQRGEIECTEKTPCFFCSTLARARAK